MICVEMLDVCSSGINSIEVNQACSENQSISCCIQDYQSCDYQVLIKDAENVFNAFLKATGYPKDGCNFSQTAEYVHDKTTLCK